MDTASTDILSRPALAVLIAALIPALSVISMRRPATAPGTEVPARPAVASREQSAAQTKSPEPPSPQPPTTEAVTQPAGDTITYHSRVEGFTLRYPSSWTLRNEASEEPDVMESFTLRGPNHFLLNYTLLKGEKHSHSTCKDCKYIEAVPLSTTNLGKMLYVTIENRKLNALTYHRIGIAESPDMKSQPHGQYAYYGARSDQSAQVIWSGYYIDETVDGFQIVANSYSDFTHQAEVQTAREILFSLKY